MVCPVPPPHLPGPWGGRAGICVSQGWRPAPILISPFPPGSARKTIGLTTRASAALRTLATLSWSVYPPHASLMPVLLSC